MFRRRSRKIQDKRDIFEQLKTAWRKSQDYLLALCRVRRFLQRKFRRTFADFTGSEDELFTIRDDTLESRRVHNFFSQSFRRWKANWKYQMGQHKNEARSSKTKWNLRGKLLQERGSWNQPQPQLTTKCSTIWYKLCLWAPSEAVKAWRIRTEFARDQEIRDYFWYTISQDA